MLTSKKRRILKDPFSGISHFLTALAAVAGSFWILSNAQPYTPKWMALVVYCITLVTLFLASSAYHLIPANRTWERRLRKIDHAAIFLFIAGSYTPICEFALNGKMKTFMLVAVWTCAGLGMSLKLIYSRSRKWLSVGSYLATGWLALLAIGELYQGLPFYALVWLVGGGVFYSLGALIYATRSFNFFPNVFGFHEVWHLFVMAGSAAHFIVVAGFII